MTIFFYFYIVNIKYWYIYNREEIKYKLKNIIIYGAFYSLKNIIFMVVPVIFFINYKILLKNEFSRIIFILFLLNIGFIISAYMFREMEIVYSLRTTMDRIIFTSSGIYVFYLINFFNNKNYFKKYSL